MKKAFAVILLLVLVLTGCHTHTPPATAGTEFFHIDPNPTFPTEAVRRPNGQTAEELALSETEAPSGKDISTDTADTVGQPTVPPVAKPDPTKPESNKDPQPTAPPQGMGDTPTTSAPNTPVPPTQAEPVPTEPESTNPETEPTEPAIPSTVPPAGSTGCTHDWKRITHPEEGYWRAGIICDCGWTIYGEPSKLTSQWNAHSASFPPAEALFDHGGFGSMDEWIVVKPAYDEWVCRHCGEKK